jgi:hypothetical protein
MRAKPRLHHIPSAIFAPLLVVGMFMARIPAAAAQVFIASDEVMVIPDPTLVDKLYLAFRNNPPGWFLVQHPFLSILFTVAIVAWALNRERESREDASVDPVALGVTPGWEPPMTAASPDRPAWLDGETAISVGPRQVVPKPIEMGDANPVDRPAWMS